MLEEAVDLVGCVLGVTAGHEIGVPPAPGLAVSPAPCDCARSDRNPDVVIRPEREDPENGSGPLTGREPT